MPTFRNGHCGNASLRIVIGEKIVTCSIRLCDQDRACIIMILRKFGKKFLLLLFGPGLKDCA